MKKPEGQVSKKPAASGKPAAKDTSLVAPAASDAIVPIDEATAPQLRDLMKARKFQNLWGLRTLAASRAGTGRRNQETQAERGIP